MSRGLLGGLVLGGPGVLGVVHGEQDDSPGLQLLGVALVAGAAGAAVRLVRRGRR